MLICRFLDIEIPHERDSQARCIVPADMRSDRTCSSRSSLIDIAVGIYEKIIADISPAFGERMIFIDILDLFDDSILASRQKRGIIVSGMMDDDLALVFVDAFRPLEVIAAGRFAIFIHYLLSGSVGDQIIGSHLTFIYLLLPIQESIYISLHELTEFGIELFLTDCISLGLGCISISPRFISSSLSTSDDTDTRQAPTGGSRRSDKQYAQRDSEDIFFIHIYKVYHKR